jgi:putative DNA primase/helicase
MNGAVIRFGDVRRVPYRWLELLQYPDAAVFVTEGGKDADNVAKLGHCATTVAHGKWTEDCVKALADRHIIIIEDNDAVGRKKAREAAELLHSVAASVRIVSLPGLAEKEDVSDWLELSRLNTVDKLIEISFNTPLWQCSEKVCFSNLLVSREFSSHDLLLF